MYNGVSEEVINSTKDYKDGYLKGVQDAQIVLKEKEDNKKKILDRIKEVDEFKILIKSNFGNFYFNFYNRLLELIEPQYLTRFLYLCTYMDYDGRLVQRVGIRNICIKENELQYILKLSRTETYNTKVSLLKEGLIAIDNDIVYINSKYCRKGDIMKNSKVEKARMFDDSIREIYQMSTKTEHKKIALLFQLLPYINLRWNVICKNPTEEILEEVIPYSMKELSLLLGQTNITRFKKYLIDLTVKNEAVVFINTNKYGELITINPKIYYKGVDINELDYLIKLFRVNKDQ